MDRRKPNAFCPSPCWLFVFLLLLAGCACRTGVLGPVGSYIHQDPAKSLAETFPPATGWNKETLEQARTHAQNAGITALVIIHQGRLVAEWGDTTKRTSSHSVRKSLISALYGIAVQKKLIDLSATLQKLGIDDKPPKLTPTEKTATVRDLLMARSGVYHHAASESKEMKARRPKRGSHKPGTFWYYNNWDFNVLGYIFGQKTGLGIGPAFNDWIAQPMGMQDFRPLDVRYGWDLCSYYPSYPFYISARDLARFGVLYLNQGSWRGRQVVPASWVKESTKPYSIRGNKGYGYMWWVDPKQHFYYAAGYGGQMVVVAESLGLVVVTRVDSGSPGPERREWLLHGKSLSGKDMDKLAQMILKAMPGQGASRP